MLLETLCPAGYKHLHQVEMRHWQENVTKLDQDKSL